MSKALKADGYWLSGLTDGEGCFYMDVRKRKIGVSIDFCFKIAMRADDKAALDQVQKILGGIGTIGSSGKKRHAYYKNRLYKGRPILAFRVYKKEHLAKVIAFFTVFPLRSKKQRDFALWSFAVRKLESAINKVPLLATRNGSTNRPSATCRRPIRGTKRQRFKSAPPELIAEMREISEAIRRGRTYK